jgi:hypothetical protein
VVAWVEDAVVETVGVVVEVVDELDEVSDEAGCYITTTKGTCAV